MKIRFVFFAFTLAMGLCALGCGGSNLQADMPDPSVLDQTADDLELAEEQEESASEEAEAASETAAEAESSEAPAEAEEAAAE